MAGYSKRALVDKLGLKPGFRMTLVNPPTDYFKMLAPLPPGIQILNKATQDMDFIHFFTSSRGEYEKKLPGLKKSLKPNGMIWASWPKAASNVATDVTEKVVRDFALKNGLVDIKVCAVDETWSGLKLVIPVKNRNH